MADSPHTGGCALLRNVSIEEFPGALKAGKDTTALFPASFTGTFTADAGTDVCTCSSGLPSDFGSYANCWVVQFTTTNTLPAGLSLATNYFLSPVSTTTFKVSTTIANALIGTGIDITDAGTGVHTLTFVSPGTINYSVEDPRINLIYYHDSNGRVWFDDGSSTYISLLNGNTLTNSSGRGLAIFRPSSGNNTYLLVFRNATIDVVNVFGSTQYNAPSWTTAWQSLNSGAGETNSHMTLLGQDNMMYFCDSKYVGSIRETAGSAFDPANAATFTYNSQALDMPQGEVINWLEELGTNLLSAGNTYDKIYPWDRVSDSFNLPLQVPEMSIKRIKNLGNIVYILAGTKGNIYTTQGTYVKLFKKLSDFAVNNASALLSNPVTWGGIAISNGALLFGVAGQTTANNGVWKLYPDGRLLIDNQPSSGAGNATTIFSKNDFYSFGYTSGVDKMSTSRFASYEGVANSELYEVGTKTDPVGYGTVEVQIAKPAANGHVRISYRTDTTSSFTTLLTCTADGTATSFKTDAGLINIENIQLQAEIDGLMELREVRLLP